MLFPEEEGDASAVEKDTNKLSKCSVLDEGGKQPRNRGVSSNE